MTVTQLNIPIKEIHLEHTLVSGQAFRWTLGSDGWWSTVLTDEASPIDARPVLIRIRQDDDAVYLEQSDEYAVPLVRNYFRFDTNLQLLSQDFADRNDFLRAAVLQFPGLRLLQQHPVENLFSFLCATASPLHRIRRNIGSLCTAYGKSITHSSGQVYAAFPTVDALAQADEAHLREMGLGYRARYICAAAKELSRRGGTQYLLGLRTAEYGAAKEALMQLPGIGNKVADCVCLFSLQKDEAVPIDTHIRRIAGRDFGLQDEAKRLSASDYALIAGRLREHLGSYAGWAQQYLFFHELYGKGSWPAYTAAWKQ